MLQFDYGLGCHQIVANCQHHQLWNVNGIEPCNALLGIWKG